MRWRLLLIASGLGLIVASLLAPLLVSRTVHQSPGKLVAERESLRWRSPAPSQVRSSQWQRPRFEVLNVGGSPVRILAVKTSCGCATARAEPRVVPPKGKAVVIVDADPLEFGSRAANILLETDTPASPELQFQLFMDGYRLPPYILQVKGDLFYQGGYSTAETREVSVEAVEPEGLSEAPLQIASDLPFFQIGAPEVDIKRHAFDPSLVVRTYRYRVGFGAKPPTDPFNGQVSVIDPWIRDRVIRIVVHGEANRPIQAFPSHINLVLNGAEDTQSHIRFFARAPFFRKWTSV